MSVSMRSSMSMNMTFQLTVQHEYEMSVGVSHCRVKSATCDIYDIYH